MDPFEAGLHGEVEQGTVDLGLIVTEAGVGVALDAPRLGQLRAAFDLLTDGTAKLTSLSREGVPVLGLSDHAALADLTTRLEQQQGELDAAQRRITELEATLAEHDAEAERRLEQAQSALGATQASLEQTDARQHQASAELETTKKVLAETEARLRRMQTDLQTSKAAFTETDLKLRSAQAEAAAAKAQLGEANGRYQQSQAELAAVRKSLGEVEGRMRRVQTQADLAKEELDARVGASAAELTELEAKLHETAELRSTQDALLDQSRAELERVTNEKESESQRAEVAEVERDEALKKLQLAEDERKADVEALAKELADARIEHAETMASVESALQSDQAAVTEQLEAERKRAAELEQQLKDERAVAERQKGELEEERARRDEMVRDLAYIQTQVSDLASTKGALVSRVRAMTDRETKRQRTTADMTDVLRNAEVVAADTKASARRYEARALKLEDQVRGMTQEIVDLRGALQVAENSVLMLGEQLAKTTRERDSLKVDVGFFQKQIGALQRAAAQEKLKPKK
jgi:chromosome segregation ATPase